MVTRLCVWELDCATASPAVSGVAHQLCSPPSPPLFLSAPPLRRALVFPAFPLLPLGTPGDHVCAHPPRRGRRPPPSGRGEGGEADDDGDDPKAEALPATVDEPDDASLGGVSIDSDLEHRAEDEDESEDYILAQHDRVTRKSGKWKVQLKDGVVHVGGVDYLFNKGTADLNWA